MEDFPMSGTRPTLNLLYPIFTMCIYHKLLVNLILLVIWSFILYINANRQVY